MAARMIQMMNPGHDADQHLANFLAQQPRTAADRVVQDAIGEWLQCGRLPASPAGVRLIQRNRLLRRTAEHIEAPTPWQCAGKLLELVRLFRLRKWPVWHRLDTAPPHATDIERLLFDAFRLGDDMPDCQRSYYNILPDD